MSVVLVHSHDDIWSTKISNFINFLCICEVLTLCSLRFAYTKVLLLTIMMVNKVPHFYYSSVFTETSKYLYIAFQYFS